MLARPEGATMSELIAATGGPQYNVLRRLKARGCDIRMVKEAGQTRYRVVMPLPKYELPVSRKGQLTLPKELREKMRIAPGGKVSATLENGKVVIAPKTTSIRDAFGLLGKPPKGKRLAIEDVDTAIAEAVVKRYLKAVGPRR
jgi:AbrB family looped-hinge helix DNA binding protein